MTLAEVAGRMRQWIWTSPPTWSELAAIGNSPIARATMAIPIVGYLLIFSDPIVQTFNNIERGAVTSYQQQLDRLRKTVESLKATIPKIGEPANPAVAPSPETSDAAGTMGAETKETKQCTWGLLDGRVRLALLYYGLMLFASGSLLFLLCPRVIKLFKGDDAYYAARFALFTPSRYEQYVSELSELRETLKKSAGAVPRGEIAILESILGAASDASVDVDTRLKNNLPQLMASYYNIHNFDNLGVRRAITLLFVIGIGMTILPSLDTFIRVNSTFFLSC